MEPGGAVELRVQSPALEQDPWRLRLDLDLHLHDPQEVELLLAPRVELGVGLARDLQASTAGEVAEPQVPVGGQPLAGDAGEALPCLGAGAHRDGPKAFLPTGDAQLLPVLEVR